jgi:hypothetical protein
MTKDHSDVKKPRTVEPAHLKPVATPAPEETIVAAVEAEPIVTAPVLKADVEETVEPFGYAAGLFVDASPFAKKSLEIWDENLNAFLTHVESLSGAKSVEEAIALQTRFATECFESFGRQSRDLVALTQQLASFNVAPLCGTRAAA